MGDSNKTETTSVDHMSLYSELLLSRSAGQIGFESGSLLLINLTAMTGNLLIATAMYRNRRLQTATNMLILALAAVDTLMAAFCLPISLGVLVTGRWLYNHNTCWAQCFCIYFAAYSSLYTITLTALNRYVRVVKTQHFNKLFSTKATLIKVVAVWIGISFILSIFFLCGLIRANFSPAQAACVMFLNRKSTSKVLTAGTAFFIMFFFAILPTTVTLFCYVRVFRTVKEHFARVSPSLEQGNRNLEMNLVELKVTKTLFIVVIGFLLCWSPIFVVEILEGFFIDWWKLPRPVHMLWTYLGALSCALNPFIYGTTNKDFKKEFKDIVCWPFRMGVRVTADTN